LGPFLNFISFQISSSTLSIFEKTKKIWQIKVRVSRECQQPFSSSISAPEFKDYEWMMEEGADEKLEKEIEEQLKFAELERMMMQEEAEAGDLQV